MPVEITSFDVLDLLTALVDKSLVVFEETNGQGRYRLMETVRQYAGDRMADTDTPETVAAVRENHADYFLRFAHEAVPHLQSAQQGEWLRYLSSELGNLRTALDWLHYSRPTDALHLAADLTGFWNARALLSEGRAQFARLLDESKAVTLPLTPETENAARAARAKAANGAGTLAMLQADYAHATRYHNEARELFAALNDAQGEGDALHGLGNVAYYERRFEEARTLWRLCLLRREAAGDMRRTASSLHSLGNVEMREDRPVEAESYFSRSLVLRRTLGEPQAIAASLGSLGQLAFNQDDLKRGRRYAAEALTIFNQLGVGWAVALGLSDMARASEDEEHWADAARLLSASSRLRETVGFPHPPAEQDAARKRKADLQEAMGQAAFNAAWAQGQADTIEEAVAFALQTV